MLDDEAVAAEQDARGREAPAPPATHGARTATPPPAPRPEARAAASDGAVRLRAVVPGVVAYLRCEGLEARGGRFPCPRDPALEAAAWSALDGLAKCSGVDPTVRSLEARLTFTDGRMAEARFRGDEPELIDASAIDACVGAPLRGLSTMLRSDRLLVAFHVELR